MRVNSPAKRKKVCIVEDVADSRNGLKILLEHTGYHVFDFPDGDSALNAIPEIQPDAAIIDIGLPGKSGLDVAHTIRFEFVMSEIFLVALTGYPLDADGNQSKTSVFDRILIKPAGIIEVRQTLTEFFDYQTQEAAA